MWVDYCGGGGAKGIWPLAPPLKFLGGLPPPPPPHAPPPLPTPMYITKLL